MKIVIGYIFAFYATKMGSRDSGETKVDPHWVQDPPWSFNGPWHGPTIHQTWPFIFWLYFCILCNKKGIKGLWGHKFQPSLGLGPALVLQWTLPWPYNTPEDHVWCIVGPWQGPLRDQGGPLTLWGQPLSPLSQMIPYLWHRMQKYSQYIKDHVWCIVGPWQGPLRDQGGSWTLWGSTLVSPESLDPIFVA